MIELKKDKKGKTYILTTTDSEGFHRQVNLTEEDIDRLMTLLRTEHSDGYRCLVCSSLLCWDNDYDLGDVTGTEDDGGGIMTTWHCPHCGRTYEIYDPSKEEKESQYSDYWQD